jgi:hypothetical protein
MKATTVLFLALAALAGGASVAQSDNVGAPTSAAGGISPAPLVPPVPDLPGAAGPQAPSATSHGTPAGTGSSDESLFLKLAPGTGKFEAPNNAPCIGATGFGSTNSQPGHKC